MKTMTKKEQAEWADEIRKKAVSLARNCKQNPKIPRAIADRAIYLAGDLEEIAWQLMDSVLSP